MIFSCKAIGMRITLVAPLRQELPVQVVGFLYLLIKNAVLHGIVDYLYYRGAI